MENLKEFLQKNTIDGGFLQSEYWQKFQQGIGRKVYDFEQEGCSRALAILCKLPFAGGYLFVPRGPVLQIQNSKLKIQSYNLKIKDCLNGIVKLGRRNGAGWIRIEPQRMKDLELIKEAVEGKYKIVKTKKDHEPRQTLMLDLGKSEDELLNGMKPKTRYNIRLAEKKGVKVICSREDEDVEKFISLLEETARRDKIGIHDLDYYRQMTKEVPEEILKLYLAMHEREAIAGALVSFYGGVAVYWHGGSSSKKRNLMAPYALQWRAIRDAKKNGFEKYDFGGIRTNQNFHEEEVAKWQGITKFKEGFCSKEGVVDFPGCWDIVLDFKKYYIYKVLQGIKDAVR